MDRLRVPRWRDVPARHLGLVSHEEVVEVARQEPGGGRLLYHDVDDIFAVKATPVAQEGLLPVVMIFRLICKAPVKTAQGEPGELRADSPAGEGARGFLDIVLAVITHPHGEQLQ